MTPAGSFRADLAVEGGRISAIEPDLSSLAASAAREVVDAAGPPRPAGDRRRPHPYPGRLGRRARSLLPGFGRRGVRRHDDLPRVQQPGHGLVARGGAIARRWTVGVAGGDLVRRGRRLRGQPGDQRPDGRSGRRAGSDRRRGRADGQGVHGLRLPARQRAPVRGASGRWAGGAAGSRSTARIPP